MKTFYDLNDEEKISLSDEQVEYYARVECANRGIVMPIKPVGELKEVQPPTTKFYTVGYDSKLFLKESDAELYCELIYVTALSSHNIGKDYETNTQYAKKQVDRKQEIKSNLFYTEEEAISLKEILQHNADLKSEIKKYNEANASFLEIQQNIFAEISEISYKKSRLTHFLKIYDDYVVLAESNLQVAYSFFEKAYKNAQLSDIDSEVVSEILKDKQIVESPKESLN